MVKISKISNAVAIQILPHSATLLLPPLFDLPSLLVGASKAGEGVNLAETIFILHEHVSAPCLAFLAVYLHFIEGLSTLGTSR